MNEAEGDYKEDHAIVEQMFGLNFTAIHPSSMVSVPSQRKIWTHSFQAVTHALFDLAANPEYLIPLREEVEEVTKREGWSKSAIDQMHKLDSFLKESQRFHPVGIRKLACFNYDLRRILTLLLQC